MPSVCFVCLGNICRSPMAHAIAEHLAQRDHGGAWTIDSCGTGAWHVGNEADPRTEEVLAQNGIKRLHSARQLSQDDYLTFDYLIGMDAKNLADMHDRAPAQATASLHLLGEFDPEKAGDVADPYYGGPEGFSIAFDQIWRSCEVFFATHTA